MKKIIILHLLLITTYTTFSQQPSPNIALTKQDLLKKSKSQKTAAWLLAGGGVATAIIAISTYSIVDFSSDIFVGTNKGDSQGVIMIIGGVVALSSIPLFIASGRNKKKAMSLSLKNETAPQIKQNSFVYRAIPSLSLKISL